MTSCDFMLVGGGVIGLSIARELKNRHRGRLKLARRIAPSRSGPAYKSPVRLPTPGGGRDFKIFQEQDGLDDIDFGALRAIMQPIDAFGGQFLSAWSAWT